MPAPSGTMIPPDAMDKANEKVKTVDYYADLTDEERAAEGLPPREPAKEPAPAEKPPDEKPTEEEEETTAEDDDATLRLFEEVASLRKDLSDALEASETPPAAAKKEDLVLKAALEHEDPVVRELAGRLRDAEKRQEALETDARAERIGRQRAKDEADFTAVQATHTIGGKPMTDEQVEMVEDYIVANPEVGSRLTIEQVTRVVFPNAVKIGPKAPPASAGPGDSRNGKGSPVATIVDEGSAGGATAGPWKPRPNESVESAVEAAAKRFGWKR